MKKTFLTSVIILLLSMFILSSYAYAVEHNYQYVDSAEAEGSNIPEIKSAETDAGLFEEFGSRLMPVVSLPADALDDMNENRIEDVFEPVLDTMSDNDVVEAIIRTEFFIDSSFTYYLQNAGAEIVYVAHGVESAGIKMTKADLLDLAKDPRIAMIFGNHQGEWMLNTAVPVIRADPSTLNKNGHSDVDGSGVTIAIIDTGIDGSHRTFPDGKIIAFKDFNGGQDDLNPTDGMDTYDSSSLPHGTMCASCAAGTGGGTNYAGSAPGAYLIVVRVGGSSWDIQRSVQWCINNKDKDFNKDGTPDGPDVISMSLGTSPSSQIDQVCEQAVDAGIVFVTSAGNYGPSSNTITSPARAKKIIAIGGTHDNKNIWSSSSRGPGANGITKPDVCAVGAAVTVAYPGNYWTTTSGTSFSGPTAAGVVALMLEVQPDLTTDEVMQILHDSAEDRGSNGPDNDYGWGVVDAVAALDTLLAIREITLSKTNVEEDEVIEFNAEVSGKIEKYEWDFDDDGKFEYSSTTTPKTTFSYETAGYYQTVFKITDYRGKSKTMSELVVVNNVEPEIDVVVVTGNYMNEDDIITFNVSGTYDTPTDKSKLEYFWNFGDETTLETTAIEVEHVYTDNGVYDVEVIVKDDNNAKDSTTVQMTISNLLPVADAGVNRDVKEDEWLFFSAENSFDSPSDLMNLNYTWDMDDGKKIYKREFFYSYKSSQKYSVSLTVRDDDGGSDRSTIYINVENIEPSVGIVELDQTTMVVKEDEEFQLHGIANDTESDMSTLEYYWNFDDGTTLDWDPKQLTVEHSFSQQGYYDVMFRVKDDDGAVNKTTIRIQVENVAPVASFTVSDDDMQVYEDDPIYFDASDTTDTYHDLTSLDYQWEFGDHSSGTGEAIWYSYTTKGTFQVFLTVFDDDGLESFVDKTITVMNHEPKAEIYVNIEEAYVGEEINFSGKNSWDSESDIDILSYNWDFGDNDETQPQNGRDVKHTFTKPGEYIVELYVADDESGYDTAIVAIKINAKPSDETTTNVFDLESTEGQLIIIALILIIVLVIMLILFSTMRSKKKKARRRVKMARRRQAAAMMQGQIVGGQQQLTPYGHSMQNGQPPDKMSAPQSQMTYPQQFPQELPPGMPAGDMGTTDTMNGYYPELPQQAGMMDVQEQQQPDWQTVDQQAAMGYYGTTYPALPPSQDQEGFPTQQPVYPGEVESQFAGYTRPVSEQPVEEIPPQPEVQPQVPEQQPMQLHDSAPQEQPKGKFCGNCGTPIKSSWFICPSCKNML